MNALLSQAADLRAQARTLAEQALFGDLFASTSTETIAQLNAQADALEAQAAVVAAPAPAPAPESLRGWYTTLTVTCPLTGKVIETRETDREFTHAVAYPPCKRVKRYTVLSFHADEQAAHKSARRQGNTAGGYVVLPVNDPRKPSAVPLNDTPAVWGKIAPRRWGILKPAPAPAPEPSAAEQLDAIFEELLSPVSEPVSEIPAHDGDELLSQWRDANRAGEGRAFGDPDDLTCEADVYEAAELEGARVVCALDTPDCYLVSWSDDYYVVCDCNGWWACRVSL